MNYFIHLVVYFEIYAIVALSLNLVVGYAGMLTLAHAGFFAVGAYVYAILGISTLFGFIASMVASVAIAALTSLLLAFFSWRLKGDFFVLASLALQALIYAIAYNWADTQAPIGSWLNLTNGPFGISGVQRPIIFGIPFDNPPMFMLLSSGSLVTCILMYRVLASAGWTKVLYAMRDDELAARALGKNTRLLKVQVFAIAAGLAGGAGALYAAYVGFVDPSSASLDEGILLLCMVLIGGLGSLRGSIVGAATLVALPELLRLLSIGDAVAANVRLCIYGLMLIAMMRWRPQGIAGIYRLD